MWELGVAHFARVIQRRVELLKWWLDRDVRPTAQEMVVMYHEMIWRAMEALPVRARMQ